MLPVTIFSALNELEFSAVFIKRCLQLLSNDFGEIKIYNIVCCIAYCESRVVPPIAHLQHLRKFNVGIFFAILLCLNTMVPFSCLSKNVC